jgi:hypothetical protein
LTLIKNNFICELDLDLDMDYLSKIAMTSQQNDNSPAHHRFVKDDIYLTQIKNKYPFLSDVFNVYTHAAGYSVPIHIDASRLCAINIPICNTEDSSTIFYEKDDTAILEYESRRILNLVKSPTKECFRFTLLKPTLINTTYPHSVINNGSNTRIIISWSILKSMSFQECLMSMS